ncbi:MAG: DUF883 domain-containing protein [Verrucomicrobiota bacterium]
MTTTNGTTTKQQLNELGEKARVKANEIRSSVEQRYQQGRDQVLKAGKATDVYVRENPWAIVGAAAGIGFLLGLLIGRR